MLAKPLLAVGGAGQGAVDEVESGEKRQEEEECMAAD
jgi:hypothetical protein